VIIVWAVNSMANSNGYWQTTVVSTVHASIAVNLGAGTIPDGVRVTVTKANGASYSEYWTAGWHKCDGYDYNGDPTDGDECRTFGVDPCDEVKFEVFTDVCDLDHNSAWVLTVTCGENVRCPDNNGKKRISSEIITEFEIPGASAKAELLNVFPNPTTGIVNIYHTDSKIKYKSIRLMDISGITILSKNMVSESVMQIDLGVLQSGVYFIEITDDKGNVRVEKITKLE